MLFDQEQPDNAQAPGSAAAPAAPSAPQAESTELNAAALPEGSSGLELETEPPEPEDTDFEYEGKKFKVPKDIEGELKNALLRHRDYTQKTQEVAEQRKAFEAERTMHQQTVQLAEHVEKEKFQLYQIDHRMAQLSQVNFAALRQQNPELADQLRDEMIALQGQRPQLVNSLTQKHNYLQSTQQQQLAKRADDARAFLMREFKDWSPEKDQALEAYARAEGIDTRQLSQFLIHNPAIARVLDKAAKWDHAAKQRAAKPKPEPPPKPVTRVTGSAASNAKLPSDMTPAEHRLWRQERNQNRR
jgi:hypothetical protein